MGITIHFEGQLKDNAAYKNLLKSARTFADSRIWLTEIIEPTVKKLLRVRWETEEKWDYSGAVSGILVYLHEDCDPIRLEFDENLYLQEFVKTQFAGSAIHVQVIEFLRTIEPFFEQLDVNDEGEYWETGDVKRLTEHIENCRKAIEIEIKKSRNARSKVKTAEGRIIDLIS